MSTPSQGHMIEPTDATMVEHTGESSASGHSRGSEETAVQSPQICTSPDAQSLFFPEVLKDQRDAHPPITFVPPENDHRCLILCFDGTGDQFDADNSNIVQLVSALKKDNRKKQMVYYQSGIGTYTSSKGTPLLTKMSLILDTAIAWNLDAHVMAGYEFLMQNYTDGDRICIFGFSRGAYIARSLAGMIHKVGLLPVDNHQQVPFAYRIYARADATGWEQAREIPYFPEKRPTDPRLVVKRLQKGLQQRRAHRFHRRLGHRRLGRSHPEASAVHHIEHNRPHVPPRRVSRRASRQVQGEPLEFPLMKKRRSLERTRRQKRPSSSIPHFKRSTDPEPEDDDDMEQMKFEKAFVNRHRKTRPTDVLEVWFAGCHCDVGGGSVKNDTRHSLARIPLRWMIRECFKADTGIMFDARRLQELGLDPAMLYPVVKPRPPQKSPHIPDDLKIESIPPCKGWLRRTFSRKCQGFPVSAELAEGTPMEKCAPGMEEEEDLKDALSPMYDQLTLSPFWWILEVIPFTFRYQQKPDNKWITKFRPNLGRARKIPHQKGPDGNPVPHDHPDHKPPMNLKVHRTVEVRRKARDAKGRLYVNRADFQGVPDYVD
ncbi:hypothetical protein MVEN_00325300 [Mycena venus]|uniref:T6SS Phospholipase effector Tle1-like catalytic domain-containing protein n=1 Tax=Mycena venus TaxID=2733690 RepID=A0A8H6YNV5_9AGAR|nr:hypothetical protein MVEN_00325300 [Mycena venus]